MAFSWAHRFWLPEHCIGELWQLDQLGSAWQAEMGWPDIHWLAGINGGSVAASAGCLDSSAEYAIGT